MSMMKESNRWMRLCAASLVVFAMSMTSKAADYPPFEKVIEGYKKIEAPDNGKSMYTVYVKSNEGQVLLELPKNYSSKKYFFGLTVASGQIFAGLQAGDYYVQWRPYNKRLALIAPNLNIRSDKSDAPSADSISRLFTGRVLLDLPIITMSPRGGPVIDGDMLMVGRASTFFGASGRTLNPALAKIVKSKAFEKNIEFAFEMPSTSGTLQTLYYSISEVPTSTGYRPRKADQRIGYFTTSFSNYSKYKDDEVDINYINRWHLVKRDPKLKVSPPVEPIKFYLEHTTPVRYRRWVKAGVDYWNKAFEEVGISDAIVVEYQDKFTGAHMEKDPEDVRYNFIRWLNNNVGTAIGPSRVHPETGQILDADIVLTDGWIRYFDSQFKDYMPMLALEGASSETLAWLSEHPNWDPRVRFADAGERSQVAAEIRAGRKLSARFGLQMPKTRMMGDEAFDGLVNRTSQVNGLCLAAQGRRMDTAVMRMMMALGVTNFDHDDDDEAECCEKDCDKCEAGECEGCDCKKCTACKKDAKCCGDDCKECKDGKCEDCKEGECEECKKDAKCCGDDCKECKAGKCEDCKEGECEECKKEDAESDVAEKDESKKEEPKTVEDMLDGMPESFIGPLLADLVAHEVGHTLGLRHNFKASSLYTLEEINSEELKGKKAFGGSVMDYQPLNLRIKEGEIQGDWAMIDLGPYDMWAIEYGYSFDDKALPKILSRVSEPELAFATDEDTSGPDPLARRYDFSKEPLEYAKEQLRVVKKFRKRLMDDYVKDGDSWTKAREGYELTLSMQMRATGMMSNWIGGAYVHRDKKGDPNGRLPLEVVETDKQREALAFVLETVFRDEAYALSPELLSRLTKDFFDGFGSEPAWPVHDRILSMQASALTSLMNTTTLKRVYDNEFRVPANEDAFTLPELLDGVTGEIWSELEKKPEGKFTARKPMISSLRRNLQIEHMERLIDLILPGNGSSAAYKAIPNLCRMELGEIKSGVNKVLKGDAKLDAYTKAHLMEVSNRISKALDAEYVYNQSSGNAGSGGFFLFGKEPASDSEQ